MVKKKEEINIQDIISTYGVSRDCEMVSTGSIVMDAVLGGGVALGNMYAFWGNAGSGKSTLAFNIVRRFCKAGKKVCFVDVEKALNSKQQTAFKLLEFVENGMLTILTADNYADVYTICKAVSKSGEYSLIVVDSETMINESIPEDVDITTGRMGQKSLQASRTLNALKPLLYNNNVASIWLSHARANIDIMAGLYAPKEKMAGGYALRHVPDVILQISPGQKLKDDGDALVGITVHLQTEKNKFTRPFQKFDVKVFFGKGINPRVEVVDLAVMQGLVVKEGRGYLLPDSTKVSSKGLYDLSNEQLSELKGMLTPLISE